MKHKTLKPVAIGTLSLVALVAGLLVHQWKLRSDRAACLLNLRNMYQAIYSVGGTKGVGPGQPYPGGPRELLKSLGEYRTLPRCPSGGTYSFVSDTSYSMTLHETIRCSHAEDLNHRWPADPSGE
jgi:hypothetical protein